MQQRTLDAMSAESARSYLSDRARVALDSPITALLRKEMDFEIAFVKAGACCLPVLIRPETAASRLRPRTSIRHGRFCATSIINCPLRQMIVAGERSAPWPMPTQWALVSPLPAAAGEVLD